MYCRNCGKEIKDDATFCPYCGEPVDNSGIGSNNRQQAGRSTQTKAPNYTYQGTSNGQAPKDNHRGRIIAGVIASVVVVFIAVGLMSSSGNDSSSQSASENTSENVEQANESNENTSGNVGQANESAKFNAAETPTAVDDYVLVSAKIVETNSKGHDFVSKFTLDYEFNERNQKTKMTTQFESDTYNSLGDFQEGWQFQADDTVVFPNIPEGEIEEYTYNDNGYLTEKFVDGLIDYSYDYKYNNGLLEWALTDYCNIQYLYDENNILSSVIYYWPYLGDEIPVVEVSCDHNSKGEITKCSIECDDTITSFATSDWWSGYGVSEMSFVYDNQGNLATVSYTQDTGDHVYDWTITYQYMRLSRYLSSN